MVAPERDELLATFGFPLDGFQLRSLDALDAGASVLVAAPTGSGKTVVAEYAVARALRRGRRAFYTTPVKALSNQKYLDLVRRHGADAVGLLTGDNTINGDAPVVVMTTEVLRNMIYGRSSALERLEVVVLDEVHFLQDAYRGPVWEEVIIHLDRAVQLVCLSATVSNAEELVAWMRTVRGPTEVVVEETRPVRLDHLMAVGDRTSDRMLLAPVLVDGRPNPELARLDAEAQRPQRTQGGWQRHGRRKLFTPRRVEVVERLDDEEMLPAIYFIFSRNACDEAALTCLDAGLHLTTPVERDRIRAIALAKLDALDPADLRVLNAHRFLQCLEAGIAPHHAGMIPPFKEAVELCFAQGLVKVVFATETLAVGINMPARTVVIEKLSKFTGEQHAFLKPSEYTQLTGRAGRRGIDPVGQAVVLWNSFVPFDQVAALASSRSFALTSAFRPTYNMAANLVRSYPADRAHQLLNLSFAQYQADHDIVRLEARLERRSAALAELRAMTESPLGDIDEYRRLKATATGEAAAADRGAPTVRGPGADIDAALARLRPGDVIVVERGRHSGRVAVLTSTRRGGAAKLRVLTTTRNQMVMGAADFTEPPRAVGRIDLPTPYAPNRQSFQREVAQALLRARLGPQVAEAEQRRDRAAGMVEAHPVHHDPHLRERLKAAAQADRVEREVLELRERVTSRTESLARRFDRVLLILDRWGYVDGWELTDAGERLARLFHESDLLVVEALRTGLLDDVDPPTFAALASCFAYEHRSADPPPAPWFPSREARQRWDHIQLIGRELNLAEERHGLPLTRAPQAGFAAVAWAWAKGERFAEVVADEDLSGGDFVRTMKQVIDLVRQLADAAPEPETRRCAAEAAESLFRGVVAASSAVG